VQIRGKCFCTGLISVQAGLSGHPDNTIAVLADRPDIIVAYTGRISRIVLIQSKIVAIIPVEPGSCAKPHIALFVFQNTGNRILRKAMFGANYLKNTGLCM
jgi:hypothetical protein